MGLKSVKTFFEKRCPKVKSFLASSFLLESVALALNAAVMALWLTEKKEYFVVPIKNCLELNIFYHTVPAYDVILAGLVLNHLWRADEPPNDPVKMLLLAAGFSLYLVSGTIGVVNIIDEYHTRLLLISLFCLLNFVLLLLDFLIRANFFREPKERTGSRDGDGAGARKSSVPTR